MAHARKILVPILIASAIGYGLVFASNLRGPFWLAARQSPEYAYLLSSLNFVSLGVLQPVAAHPGIPLTLAGALPLLGQDPIQVLTDPEKHLRREMLLLIALFVASQTAFAITLWRKHRSGILSLLGGFSFLTSTTALERLTRIAPEILVLILTAWIGIVVLRQSRGKVFYLAVLTTLLLATKLTALPVAFFVFILIPPKDRKRFLFTLFPLLLIASIPYFFQRDLSGEILKGVGQSNYRVLDFIREFFQQEKGSVLLVFAGLAIALITKRRWETSLPFSIAGGMLALTPGIHYAMPFIAGIPLFLLTGSTRKSILIALFSLAILFQLPSNLRWIESIKLQTQLQLSTNQIASKLKDPIVTCNFGSSPYFALHKANYQTGSHYNDQLSSLYPNSYFCDIGTWRFANWNTKLEFKELLERERRLLLLGPPNEQNRLSLLMNSKVSVEHETPFETLYRVR